MKSTYKKVAIGLAFGYILAFGIAIGYGLMPADEILYNMSIGLVVALIFWLIHYIIVQRITGVGTIFAKEKNPRIKIMIIYLLNAVFLYPYMIEQWTLSPFIYWGVVLLTLLSLLLDHYSKQSIFDTGLRITFSLFFRSIFILIGFLMILLLDVAAFSIGLFGLGRYLF